MTIIYKTYALTIITVMMAVLIAPTNIFAAPADAPPGGTAQQRLDLRKKEQNVTLDAKELKRIPSICNKTQDTIREVQNKLAPTVNNRGSTYKKIDAKLWIIIGQLKLADKDTFNLEQQRAEYAKQVAAFDNSVAQYRQTLDDIVVMNCQADPVGFIALVRTAQEYHKQIRAQSKAINAYIVDTVKSTLSDFATELQPKPSTEGDSN